MAMAMERGEGDFRERAKRAKKVIKEIVHHKTANGGHIFTHHFEPNMESPMMSHEPEHHAFGKEDGEKIMAHFQKAAQVKMPKAVEADASGDGDKEDDNAMDGGEKGEEDEENQYKGENLD